MSTITLQFGLGRGSLRGMLGAAALIAPWPWIVLGAPAARADDRRGDPGAILHVDDDAPPGGDGADWNTAYRYLQDARAHAAASGGRVVEIRVAKGTYRPDLSESGVVVVGDRAATFLLLNGVGWLGGFAGIGAADPDQRDVALHETVLSGDLPGANSYHVVRGTAGPTSVLDGFTITQGAATGGCCSDDRGGGMYLSGGGPMVIRCAIKSNKASNNAAAVWLSNSAPVFVDCVFEENVVNPGNSGAAIQDVFGSDLTLIRCVFRNNTLGAGTTGGGAIFVGGNPSSGTAASSVTAIDCVFVGNKGGSGGAILNNGYATLTNCRFSGNAALGPGSAYTSGRGGALANIGQATVVNCTFVANTATLSGAGVYTTRSNPNSMLESWVVVGNTILWGNVGGDGVEADQANVVGDSTLTIDHSCVEGLTGALGGIGNIGTDPGFVDADGPDQLPGTLDDDLRLSPDSTCIDAADNALVPPGVSSDIGGLPRFRDDPGSADCPTAPGTCGDSPLVDIGAHEFQPPCPTDLSGDGQVNEADIAIMLAAWGAGGEGDLDGSGAVDGADLGAMLAAWGACP